MRFKSGNLVRAAVILGLLASQGLQAPAQNATGSMRGTVKDQDGAVLSGASVTVTSSATKATRRTKTSDDGTFSSENLQPGEYEVKVELHGFASQAQKLIVEVGNTTSANFSMTVGAVTQTVQVVAEAPVINKTDTVVGGIINRDRVENLPLNGRSFLSIALLEPGVNVNYNATSGAGNPNNYFQISVGSAPQQMTLISVDGARVNDRITGGTSQNFSAETVQEFQISTLGFDLSAGTVSAGAVNVVSRTGSNTVHGSGFVFYRDHNLAAFPGFRRPTELGANGLPLNPLCANPSSEGCGRVLDPFFVRRQYGGSIGGPIKKDRLFFFGNYERNDQIGANSITFSDATLLGFNHVAQQPQDGHLINTRLDYSITERHTAFVRGAIDANDGVAGTNLETTWIASSNYAYQAQMGLTSVLKPTLVNDFRFSYSYFRNRLRPPSQAECESIAGSPQYCFGLGGPRISFYGGLQIGTNINVSQDRHPRTFQWTDNVSWSKGSHRIRFGGNWEHSYAHGTWNQNAPGSFAAFTPTQLQTQSPVIYNALPASLKTGGFGATFADLLRLPVSGTLNIGIGDPGQPAPYRYNDILANDLIRFYAQDAWQMFKGFTLNYGLGWSFEDNVLYHDLDLPKYLAPLLGADKLGSIGQRYRNFDPALGFAWALGKHQKTVIRSSLSLHHTSPNVGFFNLDQRILFGPAGNGLQAFTGSLLPNPKAGQPGQPALLNFTTPANFTLADMLAYVPTASGLLAAGNPYNGTDLSVRGVQITKSVQGGQFLDAIYNHDSSRTPYTIHLNAGVQREIMHNLSVSADFVMRRGVGFGAFELFFPDLNRWNDFAPGYSLIPVGSSAGVLNPLSLVRTPVIPACTTTAQGNDPNARCSKGPFQYGLPGILSRYSALQVKVDKRFSAGFTLTGAYSLSRYWTFNTPLVITDNKDFHDTHGISGANPRHRFTASGIWNLPEYAGSQRFLRGVLNGWQLSTIMQMQTGAPTTVSLPGTLDIEGDGTYTFRLPGTTISSFGYNMTADDIRRLVGQYNASIPAGKDTPLASIPIGLQRDAIGTALPYIALPDKFASGDSFLTHDLRVTRTISITEKARLLLIAEGFNIFNIANLTGFSGTLDAYVRPTATKAANGTVTITAPGRNPATFNFGQATGRFNAIFGSGGPRAFQLAARLSF
jgi:hypothetical protein